MNNDKKIHSSKDVAKRLSIQPVTVRKYSQMLEEQGYSFTKDDKGWRQYSEEDIGFLKYLCDMKVIGKSLDESVNHIATLYHGNLSISQSAIPLQEKNPLVEFIQVQNEFNQKILKQLEASEKRQIEIDQNLLMTIKETQEVKKQLAATQQKNGGFLGNKYVLNQKKELQMQLLNLKYSLFLTSFSSNLSITIRSMRL